MKKLTIVAMAMLIVLAGTLPAYSAGKTITHVVVVWLNDDVSNSSIANIMKKTEVLSKIGVVKKLKVGGPVASERKIVDDTFTFALSVDFSSAEDLEHYLADPIHVEFVESELTPILKRIVIYDF